MSNKAPCAHMACILHFFLHFYTLNICRLFLNLKQHLTILDDWRNCSDFFPFDSIVHNGSWCPPPQYFLRILHEDQTV